MFRTISYKDLPNADLGTVGEIPLHFLFPIESVYLTAVPAYIHYNGSIIRFFTTVEIDPRKLGRSIRSLDHGSSFQIYKHHTPDRDSFFITLSKTIDYRDVIPCSILEKFSFNPVKKQINAILNRAGEAYVSFDSFLNNQLFSETDYLSSELPKLLFDFEKEQSAIHTTPVRTNMSYLKIGKSRYATTASINNVSTIPQVQGILRNYNYIERIVTVFPSKQRQNELQSHILENAFLIEHLSRNFKSDISIDTMCKDVGDLLPTFGRAAYTDVTFFLTSESIDTLSSEFQKFNMTMTDNNIALYCHTNTTRATYISFFPGNDTFGERYSLVFEHALEKMIENAMGL